MGKIRSKQHFEAKQLLGKISSWTKDEVKGLPRLYHKKARESRWLTNTGQEWLVSCSFFLLLGVDYYENPLGSDVEDLLEDSGRRRGQRLEGELERVEEQLDQRYQLFQESLEELTSSLEQTVDELDEEYQSFSSGQPEERIQDLKGEIEGFYHLIREERQSHWGDRQRLEKERREILRELEELEELDSVPDLP